MWCFTDSSCVYQYIINHKSSLYKSSSNKRQIYNSRDEIKDDETWVSPLQVCIAPVEYKGLLATMGILITLLVGMAAFSGILYRFVLSVV
jgi:hypothetical protein